MHKMVNFNDVTWENIKEHNPNWCHILDHPYRIFITGRSGSGKTNALLNLISYKPDIDRILYLGKRFIWSKIWSNKCESAGLKHCDDSKICIENSKWYG